MALNESGNPNIQVEITDISEFHCFRLVLNPQGPVVPVCSTHGLGECDGTGPACVLVPPRLEIMLHARSLVDLIHKLSLALCDWQKQTTTELLQRATGLSLEELKLGGLIAP